MALPWGEPLTVHDLEAIADDGHRYELIDGTMLATPAPVRLHQRCVARLVVLVSAAAGADHEVLPAPFGWIVDERTKFQPDVLVARRDDAGDRYHERTPLLVVEVLSASTRVTDLTLKRAAYERAGVPANWIVDAETPRLTVLHLRDGTYVEVATAAGTDLYTDDFPFPVAVAPSALVG